MDGMEARSSPLVRQSQGLEQEQNWFRNAGRRLEELSAPATPTRCPASTRCPQHPTHLPAASSLRLRLGLGIALISCITNYGAVIAHCLRQWLTDQKVLVT